MTDKHFKKKFESTELPDNYQRRNGHPQHQEDNCTEDRANRAAFISVFTYSGKQMQF